MTELGSPIGDITETAEEIERHYLDCVGGIIQNIIGAAIDFRKLEHLGKDTSKLPYVRYIRMIASGKLAPEVLATFYRNWQLVLRLRNLPIEEQRRLTVEKVPVLAGGEVRLCNLDLLSGKQLRQVIAADHIRTPEEQGVWEDKQKALVAPEHEIAGVQIDRRARRAKIGDVWYTPKQVASILAQIS